MQVRFATGWVRRIFTTEVVLTHYSDVIMTTVASQITSLTVVYSTVYSSLDQSKRVENLPVTGEFPAQRASNAENGSIWWRHHENFTSKGSVMISPNMVFTYTVSMNDIGALSSSWKAIMHLLQRQHKGPTSSHFTFRRMMWSSIVWAQNLDLLNFPHCLSLQWSFSLCKDSHSPQGGISQKFQ